MVRQMLAWLRMIYLSPFIFMMQGGGTSGGSSTTPLSGAQRANLYKSALSVFAKTNPEMFNKNGTINAPEYQAPEYSGQRLSQGDYEKLQTDMLKGNTAGLDYAKNIDMRYVNDDAAKRGVWSSGLAMQGEKDISNAYAPSYAKAGGDATAARYAAEQSDNQFDSGQRNSFEMENANRLYNSEWAPANYLKDVYNGTQGTISGGGGGWNFSI